MEAEGGSEGIKLMFSQTEMSLIYLFPHLRCGARAHLGGEKEEEKAHGAGHTWGDLDEFPSDAACWDETVKRKKAREHGQQKSVGHCNEKKKVLVLHLHPDFGLKRCKELKTAGGEESC